MPRPSTFRPSHPHASTSTAPARFHLGEPITIDWHAPDNHSKKDWIGIYRLGANKSKLVTRVSSQGHWIGVHGDEWEGDLRDDHKARDADVDRPVVGDAGSVSFSSKQLPWAVGNYELR